MKASQRVVKNFLSLGFADVVVRLSSAALTIYIARYLGVEAFGQLAFASAFASYFVLFSTFGLPTLAIREIAKNRQSTNFLATNITALQLGLAVLATLLLTVSLFFIPLEKDLKLLTFLVGLSMVPNALGMGYVFEAHEKMEFSTIIRVSMQIFGVGATLVLIYLTGNIVMVPVAQFIASVFAVVLTLVLLKKYLSFTWDRINKDKIKKILKQATPFVIAAFTTHIYYTFDSIFIQFFQGSEAVGYYNATQKIVLLLISGAGFFQAAIYPTLSNLLKNDPGKIQSLLNRTSKLLILFAMPVAIGGTAFSQQIIEAVYGEGYQLSVWPLRVLIWTVFTIYTNVSFGTLLLAGGREKKYTRATVIGSIINLFLIFILLPPLGLVGAALARIVTEFFVLIRFYTDAQKVVVVKVVKTLAQALIASVIMISVLLSLRLSIIPLVAVGAALYLTIVIVLKFVEKEDLLFFTSIAKKST